jgi:alcohol dehydrogenase
MMKYLHKANILFGDLKNFQKLAKFVNFKNVALIVDGGVVSNQKIKNFIKAMPYKYLLVSLIREPSYHNLDELKHQIRNKGIKIIIAIGGGSTMDLAKGLAVLATNPGRAINYKGFPNLKHKPLPVITIPTLPGTGSEVAYNAVFTDSDTKTRLGINTVLNFPKLTFIDPSLAKTAPKQVLSYSLMDALCHALSSYISPNATPITKALAKEAYYSLAEGIIETDYTNMFWGSMMANMSLNNAGCGLEGSFSYTLGAHYGVPHGLGEGIFLPHLMKLYIDRGFKGYTYREFLDPDQVDDVEELIELYKEIPAPTDLNKWCCRKDIPLIIRETRKYYKDTPKGIKFTIKDAREMLEKYITREE